MSIRYFSWVLLLLAGVVTFSGCELVPPPTGNTSDGSKASSAPGNPENAGSELTKFMEIAQRSIKEWDVPTASLLATQMARSGPKGADPLLDQLANPATKSEVKVLITMVMVPLVSPEMVPRLVAMTQPGQNEDTRGCATQLLGMVTIPDAVKRTRELLHDPDLRVQFAAVYCLMRDNDDEAINLAVELWKRPELNLNQRVSLVQVVPVARAAAMTPICREAAVDLKMDANTRVHAMEVLVKAGSEDAIATLKQCAENDPEPRIREYVKAGLASLAVKKPDAAPAVPAETAAPAEPAAPSAPAASAEPAPPSA